mgnify:CR=1 FL=1
MKYLLLVIYLFSTASLAGHCAKGAKHDRDHDEGAMQSEMKEESSMKKDYYRPLQFFYRVASVKFEENE